MRPLTGGQMGRDADVRRAIADLTGVVACNRLYEKHAMNLLLGLFGAFQANGLDEDVAAETALAAVERWANGAGGNVRAATRRAARESLGMPPIIAADEALGRRATPRSMVKADVHIPKGWRR